jgi:hypothetical protein
MPRVGRRLDTAFGGAVDEPATLSRGFRSSAINFIARLLSRACHRCLPRQGATRAVIGPGSVDRNLAEFGLGLLLVERG